MTTKINLEKLKKVNSDAYNAKCTPFASVVLNYF